MSESVLDVLDSLPGTMRTMRALRGLSLRAAASEIGVSFSTLTRLENGEDVMTSNVRLCLTWLAGRPTQAAECLERCPIVECACRCTWEHSDGKPVQTHRCSNEHYWGGRLAEVKRTTGNETRTK